VANVYQNDTTSSDLRGFINIYENTEENGFVLNNSMGEYDFSQIHMQDLNNDGDTELLMESLILEYEGDVVHPARAIYTFQFHVFDYDVQKEVFSMTPGSTNTVLMLTFSIIFMVTLMYFKFNLVIKTKMII